MKKSFKYLIVVPTFLILAQSAGAAMENKIKFDKQTFYLSNPETKTEKFVYILKTENIGNHHSQIIKEIIRDNDNPTKAAAEFAYKIQSDNPGASVLVYPEAATAGYIDFPKDKSFYEYNAVVFKKISGNALEKTGYSKRFYSAEHGGAEGARLAAITFAENNNKKYMEMINKISD